MAFSKKFQKQTNFFILHVNEKCEFSNCNAFWNDPRHRFKSNLNFAISSVSTSSVFWARSLNPCKKPMTKTILLNEMSPVKRICVFEHSVMTNFNCACPAIQRGQGSGFLSEGSSWLTACMSEQRRFWRDCADAQARLNLRCSHRR